MIKVRNISKKLIGIENKNLMPGEEMPVSYVNAPLKALEKAGMITISEVIQEKPKANKKLEEVLPEEPEDSEEPAAEVRKTTAKRTTKKKA